MEAISLSRPLVGLAGLLSRSFRCQSCLSVIARRHESSYRRTKHRLNVKPDSSFLPSSDSSQQDHIVFNPPSSAPSVQHTPLIFLPKEDKRKQLFARPDAQTASTRLPPAIPKFKPMGIKHHLAEADIAEIRRLRGSDPFTWTTTKLARKFNCSMFFVRMCCEAPPEKKELEKQKVEALRARWGPRRTRAREDRLKRKELALKDE
jgi:hypothetical protein